MLALWYYYADTTADLPKEDIEMTRNQVYGVPLTKGQEDMVYGVTNQVCGVPPLTAGAGHEAAADITMEENVGYGVTSDSKRITSQDESYEYI